MYLTWPWGQEHQQELSLVGGLLTIDCPALPNFPRLEHYLALASCLWGKAASCRSNPNLRLTSFGYLGFEGMSLPICSHLRGPQGRSWAPAAGKGTVSSLTWSGGSWMEVGPLPEEDVVRWRGWSTGGHLDIRECKSWKVSCRSSRLTLSFYSENPDRACQALDT